MTPVEVGESNSEPAWDNFGIRRTDFRPNWDGDLVNVFSTVEPQSSESATENFLRDCTRSIAKWILENREEFGASDKFQIIIGWPKSIRETNRQIIRAGGTYEELREIVTGNTLVEPRKNWNIDVFE